MRPAGRTLPKATDDSDINAIYLYDDKVLITFNYKEGTQTVTFGEAAEAASKGNGSDLDCIPAPKKDLNSNDDDRSQRLKQGGVVGAAF